MDHDNNDIYDMMQKAGLLAHIENQLRIVWEEYPEIIHDIGKHVLEYTHCDKVTNVNRMTLSAAITAVNDYLKSGPSSITPENILVITRAKLLDLR